MEEEKQKDTEPGETSCSIREVEKYHTIEGKTKKKVMEIPRMLSTQKRKIPAARHIMLIFQKY